MQYGNEHENIICFEYCRENLLLKTCSKNDALYHVILRKSEINPKTNRDPNLITFII